MWSDDDGPYDGVHYRLAETVNVPAPYQRPHPPILVGGSGERKTLRLVAQYAQMCNLFGEGHDVVRHKLEVLRGHCDSLGTDYDAIEKSIVLAADPQGDPDGFLADMAGYAALGIDTVTQLAQSDALVLAAELGPTMGPWYHRIGRGVSDSAVSAEPWVPRAHGRETTFQEDLEDWDRIAEEVRVLMRQVKLDIDKEGRPAARVGLKLRYKPFFTVSRSLTLPEPSNDAAVLAQAAVSLLDRVEKDRPVRLLGVRLEMVPPEGGY
jgi:hypothetical protein